MISRLGISGKSANAKTEHSGMDGLLTGALTLWKKLERPADSTERMKVGGGSFFAGGTCKLQAVDRFSVKETAKFL